MTCLAPKRGRIPAKAAPSRCGDTHHATCTDCDSDEPLIRGNAATNVLTRPSLVDMLADERRSHVKHR
jgi:hypothetical protein